MDAWDKVEEHIDYADGRIADRERGSEGMAMCCAPIEWGDDETPNGECPECGAETVDGVAYEQCSYSQTVCEKCGSAPCDLSC